MVIDRSLKICRKENDMVRQSRKYIQTLLFAAVLVLLMNMTALSTASAAEDIWAEDSTRAPEHASDPKRIGRMLERIAEDDPERANELKQLREKDSQEFQKQIHQEMRKFFEKHGRGRKRKGRGDDKHRSGMEPMGPMGPDFMGPGGGMGKGHGKGRGGRSGGRSRDRGGRGHGGRWEDRVQGQHDEFIKWFEKNYPEKAKKLLKLRDRDPEKYMKSFKSAKKKYGEIMDSEKKNPEYSKVLTEDLKLKHQREKLVRRLNSAGADERAELLAELEDTVSKRFDLIIKKKQFRYDALKKKLSKLKTVVEKQESELDELVKSKQAAVTERVNELAGKSEKINWE